MARGGRLKRRANSVGSKPKRLGTSGEGVDSPDYGGPDEQMEEQFQLRARPQALSYLRAVEAGMERGKVGLEEGLKEEKEEAGEDGRYVGVTIEEDEETEDDCDDYVNDKGPFPVGDICIVVV